MSVVDGRLKHTGSSAFAWRTVQTSSLIHTINCHAYTRSPFCPKPLSPKPLDEVEIEPG
jgi:hypothetical protein